MNVKKFGTTAAIAAVVYLAMQRYGGKLGARHGS